MFAQLVANKRVDAAADPTGCFQEYANVLQNVGWTMQQGGWCDYTATGTAAVLGPGAGALAIATAAIEALRGMNSQSSWVTIFSREAQRAKLARFQVGLVEDDADGGVQVALLACLIEAKHTITQVLFFKFKSDDALFKASTMKVSINTSALSELQ